MNVTFLLVLIIVQLTTADYASIGSNKGKTSRMKNPFLGHSKPRFISFDSEEGNIDVSQLERKKNKQTKKISNVGILFLKFEIFLDQLGRVDTFHFYSITL